MKICTLCTRYLFCFCFLAACNSTLASEKNKVYRDQNLITLSGMAEEPSKLKESSKPPYSLSPSPSRSIESVATPHSISVSITVTKPDNPGDKGFRISVEELAQLVQLIPSEPPRTTIHQLIPTIVLGDEVCAVKNKQVRSESAKNESCMPLRRCSLLHCLYVCSGISI